ncbi:MAG: glycerate kinase [Verrucomicrobiae bacterium]|nr:glycerate kinase [Verrucomicrobiae bacterium]
MRVLIVPDKFKGTLAAGKVAEAMAAGWRRARPGDEVEELPMSDGGDGFGAVIGGLLGARTRWVQTVDAANRPIRARWWWAGGKGGDGESRGQAVIEAAQSNGLALLPTGRFHPVDLDTTGVGRLLTAAVGAGAERCLIGVGGSATNDGGFGVGRWLGWRFLDKEGHEIRKWTDLDQLMAIEAPAQGLPRGEFVVATDVGNPLLGPEGASRVYGPQKGLNRDDIVRAERCLRQLARVVEDTLGFSSERPGCGAAGGLGFGLQVFLKAGRELGFDVFARLSELARRVAGADLVLTGEGSVDESSLMGKGVGQLIECCARLGRPVVLVGGRVDLGRQRPGGILGVGSLVERVGEGQAMRRTAAALRTVTAGLAKELAKELGTLA